MKELLIMLFLGIFELYILAANINTNIENECKKIHLSGINELIHRSGCCSWHKGVCDCSASGRVICCDGTYSPSCTCRGGDLMIDQINMKDWNAFKL